MPSSESTPSGLESLPLGDHGASHPTLARTGLQDHTRVERLTSFNLSVNAGGYEERHFVLSSGDLLEGTLVEIDGQDFDRYILDHAGYASFVAGTNIRDPERLGQTL